MRVYLPPKGWRNVEKKGNVGGEGTITLANFRPRVIASDLPDERIGHKARTTTPEARQITNIDFRTI